MIPAIEFAEVRFLQISQGSGGLPGFVTCAVASSSDVFHA